QKIIAKASGLSNVRPRQLVKANADLVLGNDITAPVAIKEFENAGFREVFHKGKIALVPDHFTPNKDIKSAQQVKLLREFARKMDIKYFFEIGQMGVEHALLPELGLVV